MHDFTSRLHASELMDDPGIAADDLRGALTELCSINRTLNGYASSIVGLQSLVPPTSRSLSVLDVGTGGGDVARRIVRWGVRRGIDVRVTGIDLSPTCIEYARSAGPPDEGLRFDVADLFELADEHQFDVVHAALVLHHFNGEDAARALRKMSRLARLGLVINDLHRHPFAYYSFRLLSRVLWRNRLIRHDGPISVLRAFRRDDFSRLARDVGLPAPEVVWRWAFRWQVVCRK